MTLQQYADYLVEWLEQQRHFYGAKGYVIGISGGIDSAVGVNLLMKTGAPVQGLILPSDTTSAQDIADAYAVAKSAGCTVIEASISPSYRTFMQSMQPLFRDDAERQNVIAGNVQARLRMITLYAAAQNQQAIVVGTDNAAEWHTGYFTKYGDGGVDVVPLVQLRKEQVFELGRLLGVPQAVLDKAPSAGLWQGQTDEDEMGVSYAEIDAFLRGETVSVPAQKQIDFWHNRSHHKRMLAPAPQKMVE
ncbi:NAD(+) synthase [Testudinibacter sp. TR-2022]|uniref:NAD(+) synthase n=1 Tax=Testudinibacter sp. TR-2022 TaxID=2585029 RepID=UPI00111B5DD2|nr:NAD(+) synthase [Testudinibacter sp. TR-2022]TNH04824.1 NAD(+) synthase [Pasteurellaceae bacterium Phil31]TNH04645.1 NAD(+) synthase [Testudinibacter sp. TR-2022]TNH07956.1 NAD(+) synthase [Testudinibacter sp. TR-2022]TNH14086.1 NAD(+) synthase [Testudinibacter sp. TR-2022]TNH18388.1 NAD(+) synthase [Testudinibacter sp. TR-2022]